jgi:hypothetical protein
MGSSMPFMSMNNPGAGDMSTMYQWMMGGMGTPYGAMMGGGIGMLGGFNPMMGMGVGGMGRFGMSRYGWYGWRYEPHGLRCRRGWQYGHQYGHGGRGRGRWYASWDGPDWYGGHGGGYGRYGCCRGRGGYGWCCSWRGCGWYGHGWHGYAAGDGDDGRRCWTWEARDELGSARSRTADSMGSTRMRGD